MCTNASSWSCTDLQSLRCVQDFAEEQNQVARMVHQLQSDDPDEQFHILKTARQHFTQGGPRRVKHTLPPLAFAALKVWVLHIQARCWVAKVCARV